MKRELLLLTAVLLLAGCSRDATTDTNKQIAKSEDKAVAEEKKSAGKEEKPIIDEEGEKTADAEDEKETDAEGEQTSNATDSQSADGTDGEGAEDDSIPMVKNSKLSSYFKGWLKQHGVKRLHRLACGVSVPDSHIRIQGATKFETQEGVSNVEMEAKVTLPDGREIIDFLAGAGKDENEATDDVLDNFTLTTFHPIYATWIDPKDKHVERQQWQFGNEKRTVVLSNCGLRGDAPGGVTAATEANLRALFKKRELTEEDHWAKVVVCQDGKKLETIEVTVDNLVDEELTEAASKQKWPPTKGFYMAKEFIVIQKKTDK